MFQFRPVSPSKTLFVVKTANFYQICRIGVNPFHKSARKETFHSSFDSSDLYVRTKIKDSSFLSSPIVNPTKCCQKFYCKKTKTYLSVVSLKA